MAAFDKQKFVAYLDANVSSKQFGEHACAHFVRVALAAGGLKPITWPVPAKDWGGTLLALGFTAVLPQNYQPQLGDVVVIQPPKADDAGHIAGYDGAHWVSDFVQREMYPGPSYRAKKPAFVVYRYK
jgi:type VI secretion system secreted protein VgrG